MLSIAPRLLITAALVGSMTLIGMPPAMADSTDQAAERIVKQINSVAPRVPAGDVRAGKSAANPGSTRTDGVRVQGTSGSNSITSTLRFSMAGSNAKAVRTKDGSTVYPGSGSDASIVIQGQSSGVTRAIIYVPSATSEHSFAFSLDGFIPAVADTGQAAFISGDLAMLVAAPWARDASGRSIPTHYEIVGTSLVQVIEPASDAVYPLVADPTWQWWSGAFGASFSRSETSQMRSFSSAVGFCGIVSRAYPFAAIACAVVGADLMLQANLAENDSPQTCVLLAVVPMPGITYRKPC